MMARGFLRQAPPVAELLYVQQIPESADFYTNGRARDISGGGLTFAENTMQELHDTDQDYFVIHEEHLHAMPLVTFELTKEVYRYGGFILFKENK